MTWVYTGGPYKEQLALLLIQVELNVPAWIILLMQVVEPVSHMWIIQVKLEPGPIDSE